MISMTEKRYNTYCDQNEKRTVIDDDLNNTHIFIAYCENLNDAIRLKIALNSITDELNALHEENTHLRKSLKRELMAVSGNLCDACKHEEEDNTNNWLVGIDFDVKCRKGHKILLDDEEQECEDFELRLEDLE